MHGVDAVLRQPVGLGIAFYRNRGSLQTQPRQSASLPSDPYLPAAASDRVHDVGAQTASRDASDLAVAHPGEAALRRREPGALILVDIQRTGAVRRQALRRSSNW